MGKISDIFAGCDIDESSPTKSNVDGINKTVELLHQLDDGFVFVNLVETDQLWGHRNDPVNFHRCLQDFDRRLEEILEALRPGDLLIITSDHGCDPTTPSTDHSREHALLLAYAAGRNAQGAVHEGEFADVGRDRERVARRQVARTGHSRAVRSSTREARQSARRPVGLRLRGRQVVIRPAELIERKRNGEELSAEEISELILGYARGEIPDYQLAAFCMAVYFRGMTAAETYALTDAMIRSGRTLDLGAALGRKVVDKHSTGGVGDKTTIAVGPIVAACGVPIGKMSGRGLGHTGGTLDKLESIPGFDVELSVDQFITQVKTVGLAIVGQTEDLVPADKQLYALRDVTATVDILPLIASSIMSKKIAGGADAIVLDVKVGDGAFMKTLDDARALAETMLELGRHAGREVVCLLTDMDQPLGAAVGNSLEIAEARDTVRGEGPPDFTELVLDACARLLSLSDLGVNVEEGRRAAEAASRTARRWTSTSAGSGLKAATPIRPRCRRHRSSCR